MKDFLAKETEHSVQFSKLVTVQSMFRSNALYAYDDLFLADVQRTQSPTKTSRSTTPRRVKIVERPSAPDSVEEVLSEADSVSTAIDVPDDDDDVPLNDYISESPADNMFANLILNDEPLVAPIIKKKSPRRTQSSSSSPVKFHHTPKIVPEISEDENTKVEEIPEEISVVNYSEDFSSVPTETSTPRSIIPITKSKEKPPQ